MHKGDIMARGYETLFMLNSIEHKLLISHKYEKIKKFSIFPAQISLECYFSTIVGILTFMSRKYFMLNWVEHEKKFYNLGAMKCSQNSAP